MSIRHCGEIVIDSKDEAGNPIFAYPTDTNLPDKQNWNTKAIWVDNGRIIKPMNNCAEKYLENLIHQVNELGFTKVQKPGNRKTTTIKYAIEAYNDKFTFLK